jgi:hypothetical protein
LAKCGGVNGSPAQIAGQPACKTRPAQACNAVPREHRERLTEGAGGLHRGQSLKGQRQVMGSDRDIGALEAQRCFERGGNGDETCGASSGAEQTKTAGGNLAGENIRGNPLERQADTFARGRTDLACADLEQADITDRSRAQPRLGRAREGLWRNRRHHLDRSGRYSEGQAESERATRRRQPDSGQRELGSAGIGEPDRQRQQSTLLGNQQQRRLERCVVLRVHNVLDGAANEGARLLPEPGPECTGGVGDETTRFSLDHEIGAGERERDEALIIVCAAKPNAVVRLLCHLP